MRGNVQVRFGAERPENSSTTSGLSLHAPPGRGFFVFGHRARRLFAKGRPLGDGESWAIERVMN
jgi:hypothetical protein